MKSTNVKTAAEKLKEYIVVSDTNSSILLSTSFYVEAKKCADIIRKAGGQVTIFVSTKG